MSYVRRARSSTVRASPRTGRATSHRRGCHGWGAVKGGVRLSCMRSMGGHVCRFRIRAPGQGPFATAALMSDLLIVISTRSIAHRNRVLRAEDAWRYGVPADTAIRLARYFGTSAQVWMNLQTNYDIRCAVPKVNAVGIKPHKRSVVA